MDVDGTLQNHGKRLRHLEGLEAEVIAANTRGFVWEIVNPVVETIGQIRLLWDCTVTAIYGNVEPATAGFVAFNVEERAVLGVAGVDVMVADMQADPSGEEVTAGFANADLAEGNHLTLSMSGINGVVTCLTVTMAVTV